MSLSSEPLAKNTEASPGSTYKVVFTTANESAPSTSNGQCVFGFSGVVVDVEADSGQTLSGTGSLACYKMDTATGMPAAYMRMSSLDLSIPAGASGQRRWSLPLVALDAPRPGIFL